MEGTPGGWLGMAAPEAPSGDLLWSQFMVYEAQRVSQWAPCLAPAPRRGCPWSRQTTEPRAGPWGCLGGQAEEEP